MRTQVEQALADIQVTNASKPAIDDLCFVRTQYGQSTFLWCSAWWCAFRERLEIGEDQTIIEDPNMIESPISRLGDA